MNIEHIAIYTKDLERLKTFYIKYFQATANEKYINPRKGFQSYFLSFSSGARLEIMSLENIEQTRNIPGKPFTGIIHFAISVGSEAKVDALTSQLQQDGYPHLDGPRRTGDGYYESVVQDPDGNLIEITV